MRRPSSIEPLETRLAPALILANPLADIVAAAGQTSTGATIELGQMLDPQVQNAGHTLVKISLNIDTDANTAGLQPAVITLELFDDETPLTVANFLRYAVETDNAEQFANDFVGTYFHRSVSNFVVQGGGFIADSTLTNHITTFSTVHNEFSASRSNVRGTIAMAKVGTDDGGGPHSATSEWFVNLADNSSNLDAQNGGFTVFGQVIEGMNYIDQIAALPKASFGGLTTIPVQNYTSGKPTTDQVIKVVAVDVIKPQAGDTTGQTFEVTSITPISGDTGLLTSTITGSSLKLDYAAGKSGVADVTVKVMKDGDFVEDTFRVTVQPNLIATVTSDTLPNIVIPGDVVKASVKLSNNGGAQFQGPVQLKFYLSPSTSADPQGRIISSTEDIAIGTFPVDSVTIASDGATTVTATLTIGAHLDRIQAGYRLIAEVVPQTGSNTELFTDDNNAPNGNLHAYTNSFGTISIVAGFGGQNFNFGTRVAKLSYAEADNNWVTYSITGPGVGKVSSNEGGINLLVSGTNGTSVVNLAATVTKTNLSAARASLHHLDFANTVGTINFSQADIDGYITISSGVKVAKFGNITGNDRTLVLGAFGALNTTPATLNFQRVTDLNIESDQRIAALNAIDWLDTNAVENRILTPALTKLNIRGGTSITGDFDADINVYRSAQISSFTVKGFLRDSTITTTGNVGTVRLGGMIDSNFFVGTTARPDSTEDFSVRKTITSFTIAGVTNGGSVFFDNSQVAAATISTIVVKGIAGDNGDVPFGFVADSVLSYTRVGKPAKLNLTKAATVDPVDDYSLTIL